MKKTTFSKSQTTMIKLLVFWYVKITFVLTPFSAPSFLNKPLLLLI